MSDTSFSVQLDAPEQEARLVQAIDGFTRWRAESSSDLIDDRDTPGIMVKTRWGPDGELQKTLIFDTPTWAEFFRMLWTNAELR